MSLRVENLSVNKSSRPILSGVSFSAPTGAVTGLIGPNGAGKSTLLQALLGQTTATGTAHFGEHDLPQLNRRDRARLVAYVEQSASTEERLTVRDVVALGRIPFEPAWQAEPSPADEAIINPLSSKPA
ncbi:ATP-binding cassette domain-containing protein [Devosia aurantiaca]|uniref:ATP-binding cassette domain-containing protein n=1 Tax=Devosia aurantiaca TaxID=2714858 RepID=UPI001A9861E4|nr:ABC transporter ATP-binding protein [Devosia aurantiaca]